LAERGQRCLAASLVLPVGKALDWVPPAICQAAEERIVGYGLDEGVQMGPVISPASLQRIHALLAEGEAAGARVLVDGRKAVIPGYEKGNFLKPCVIDQLQRKENWCKPRYSSRAGKPAHGKSGQCH
jgi:malonate-semialdehyde dehydrogenase (acetylating)/methylmalonate-semialdehyde dehydrogenase